MQSQSQRPGLALPCQCQRRAGSQGSRPPAPGFRVHIPESSPALFTLAAFPQLVLPLSLCPRTTAAAYSPDPCELLTGRFNLTASTGCWKGQANWCLHSVLSTTRRRYCSWLVCLLGLLGLEVSGGGGLVLAAFAGWGWAWACVVDIWVVSSPSPITGRFLSLVPGPLSADMLPLPSHSSPGLCRGKRRGRQRPDQRHPLPQGAQSQNQVYTTPSRCADRHTDPARPCFLSVSGSLTNTSFLINAPTGKAGNMK